MRFRFVQIDLNIYNIHLFLLCLQTGAQRPEYVTSKNLNL